MFFLLTVSASSMASSALLNTQWLSLLPFTPLCGAVSGQGFDA